MRRGLECDPHHCRFSMPARTRDEASLEAMSLGAMSLGAMSSAEAAAEAERRAERSVLRGERPAAALDARSIGRAVRRGRRRRREGGASALPEAWARAARSMTRSSACAWMAVAVPVLASASTVLWSVM